MGSTTIDHSLTYKGMSLKNIPHKLRLRKTLYLINCIKEQKKIISYADFGCSNGFITNIVKDTLNVKDVYGYDHNHSNLQAAQKLYNGIKFQYLDLNIIEKPLSCDLVTCLECLEHVGDLENSIMNLYLACNKEGIILISVPIEIGIIGIAKYFIKTVFFGYRLDELLFSKSELEYLWALLRSKRISVFRAESKARGFSTHFGFDYRDIDDILNNNAILFKSFNHGFTRYYMIQK